MEPDRFGRDDLRLCGSRSGDSARVVLVAADDDRRTRGFPTSDFEHGSRTSNDSPERRAGAWVASELHVIWRGASHQGEAFRAWVARLLKALE